MTPNDIYNTSIQYETNDASILVGVYFNHIEEVDAHLYGKRISNDENKRIAIKVHREYNFDARRFWRLASVWFDNKPVMIVQNAGREGDDYYRRFITDTEMFTKMIIYLRTLLAIEAPTVDHVVRPDDNIDGLTSFYGYSA